jgi:ribosomal protein S18 acetylase RimI-like enzyme
MATSVVRSSSGSAGCHLTAAVPAWPSGYRRGVPTLTVRSGVRADLPAAVGVLGRAFQAEPVYQWLLPDPDRRRRRLAGLIRTSLVHVHTGPDSWEVATAGGQVVGVSIWDPPGHRGPGPLRRVRTLPGRIRAVGHRLDRLAELGAVLSSVRPAEPHWYLDHLAADPDVPRCGAGSALLASGLARADAAGVGVYLECRTGNIDYYRRVGFELRDQVVVGAGALRVSTMWRSPPR